MITLSQATHEICITSSYFIPDRRLRKALYLARRRGVDVSILLPALSDVPATLSASRYYFRRFLDHGMRIYLWQPSILHAKSVIIDESWISLGSSNIDHFSLHRNQETNVVIVDATIGHQMRQQFQRDLEQAKEITLEEWKQRGRLARVMEFLAHLIRLFL